MLAWLKALLGRPETALNALENDDITAEELIRRQQRLQADMAELRLEWGDHLDKLTRMTNRLSARERMRKRRDPENEEMGEEAEEASGGAPVTRGSWTPPPSLPPYDPFDKDSIRAHLMARQGRI